jgi:hypothetical protein
MHLSCDVRTMPETHRTTLRLDWQGRDMIDMKDCADDERPSQNVVREMQSIVRLVAFACQGNTSHTLDDVYPTLAA